MAKSVTRNYIYDLIYRILQILTPLITAPYISRVIGAEGIGDYSSTQAICSYFALAAILGSNVYGQREIAFCGENREKRSIAFWEIMSIRMLTITLCGVAYLFFGLCEEGSFRVLLLLQMIDVWGLVFDITWLIQGVEEFGVMLVRNLFIKFFSIFCVFVFIHKETDLYLYVCLLSLSVVFGNIALWPRLSKYVDFVKLSELKPNRHWKQILALFVPTIALRLHDSFDKTMLHYIVNESDENGFYEQARKLITMAITIVTSLSNVMLPRMAALFSKNNQEKLKEYLYNSFELVWTLALPIAFGLAAISDNIVPWFFGPGYEKVILLLKLFAPISLLMALMNVIGLQYMVPTKRQNMYTFSIMVGVVVNVAVNALMIPLWKSAGAVIASVISEAVIVLTQIWMIRKEVSFGAIMAPIRMKLPASILMAFVCYVMAIKLSPSIPHTFLAIAVSGGIYLLLLVIMKDSSIKKVYEMVRKKRSK